MTVKQLAHRVRVGRWACVTVKQLAHRVKVFDVCSEGLHAVAASNELAGSTARTSVSKRRAATFAAADAARSIAEKVGDGGPVITPCAAVLGCLKTGWLPGRLPLLGGKAARTGGAGLCMEAV